MSRKSICPICETVFEVTKDNPTCCCEEHAEAWKKMRSAKWHAVSRIKPDDLDWANARLEAAIVEIMANAAELNNTRFALKQVKADNQCLVRQGNELDECAKALEWANCSLENALCDWRAHAEAAEKITCEMLDLRDKLASAEDKIRALENGQNDEIARLEKELAARDGGHAGKMLAVAKVELEEEREKNRIIRLELETAREEIKSLARERDEARAAKPGARQNDKEKVKPAPKGAKFRNICANCGISFTTSHKDDKFCSDQCFHEHAAMGII